MMLATMLREILVLLLVAVALVAQTPSTGSIKGVVRDAGTGNPLAGVQISLAGSEQAVTDSHGDFRFPVVEVGFKRLWAFDKERGAGVGTSVLVRAGEEANADIRLKLGGTISGRVLDSSGQPAANAVVIVLRRSYRYRELVLSPGQSAATNEAGEYRLTRVAPEEALRLLAKQVLRVTSVDELPPYDKRKTVLLPEIYPETITLASGETRSRVDIRMPASPAYCIEGSADASETKQMVSFTERLSLASGWSLTPASIKASADGTFRACGLPPGAYRISATPETPGSTWRDRIAIDSAALATGEAVITSQDVLDLRLTAVPTVAIAGDAVFDPPPREKTGRIDISLMRSINGGDGYADSTDKPASFSRRGMAVTLGGGTDVPGPFNLSHSSGEWYLRVSSLPAGCYIKEAAYDRQDLIYAPLKITEASAGQRVHLVIGCDGGTVSARITDGEGNPVPGGVLYLFSADAGNPGALAATLRRADVAGGWSTPLTALRPGKYLALIGDLDISPLSAPADGIEVLWRAKSKAKEVEVGPGATVQLSILSSAALQ